MLYCVTVVLIKLIWLLIRFEVGWVSPVLPLTATKGRHQWWSARSSWRLKEFTNTVFSPFLPFLHFPLISFALLSFFLPTSRPFKSMWESAASPDRKCIFILFRAQGTRLVAANGIPFLLNRSWKMKHICFSLYSPWYLLKFYFWGVLIPL